MSKHLVYQSYQSNVTLSCFCFNVRRTFDMSKNRVDGRVREGESRVDSVTAKVTSILHLHLLLLGRSIRMI